MSRADGPPRFPPLHQHPFFLPILFVVGGWALLLGGYLPGQGDRSRDAAPPACCGHHHHAGHVHPATAPGPTPPAPADYAVSADQPVRLTIEFPKGSEAPTVVVDGRPPAPVIVREAPVPPPPIPGPPPGFDPSVHASAIPLSMPMRPVGARPGEATDPVAVPAVPLDELPESFDPATILGMARQAPPDEPAGSGDGATGPDPGNAPGDDDRAPEPPGLPLPDPNPGSSPGPDAEAVMPPAEALGAGSPSADRATRGGLRGLLGGRRPRPGVTPAGPPIPRVVGPPALPSEAEMARLAAELPTESEMTRLAAELPSERELGRLAAELPTESEMARLAAELAAPPSPSPGAEARRGPIGPELPLPDPRIARIPARESIDPPPPPALDPAPPGDPGRSRADDEAP